MTPRKMGHTKPIPHGIDPIGDVEDLYLGRYGTDGTLKIWGAEPTFQYCLNAQGAAVRTLSAMAPDVILPAFAAEILNAANLDVIDADMIRRIEAEKGHDVIAINRSLEAAVSEAAGAHVNKARTSADTTETAKALQIKKSLEVVADSAENLRDILLEKAYEWRDKPFMDTSHLLDALPTVAGRPLVHYAETIQSHLDLLAHMYGTSIVGKWGDATGNHHSATALGVDGMKLQKKYCENLGIDYMIANSQVPAREFLTDPIYVMSKIAATLASLGFYYAWGKSSDVSVFSDTNPKRRKGSAGMPHKDAAGGNPTTEEQAEAYLNLMLGNVVTSLASCKMRYARDLSGSSSDRDIFPATFKMGDHVIRRMAEATYWLELNEERSRERVERTLGFSTSPRVMAYLTDPRKTKKPMTRKKAHDLLGGLSTKSYERQIPFVDVCLGSKEIITRLSPATVRKITDPFTYTGQSKEIIDAVITKCYQKKTL